VFLHRKNRVDECIVALRKAEASSADSEVSFFLASVLSDRGKPGDKETALKLYVGLARADEIRLDRGTPLARAGLLSLRRAAFHAAVEEFLDAEKFDEADSFLDDIPSDAASELGVLAARSLVKLARGDLPGASASADEALRGVTSATSQYDLRSLALLLGKLERHNDALPLWERIAEDGHYGSSVRQLVMCAELAKRFDVILRTAKAAREAGISDAWLLYKEITVLEAFDPDRAIALLRARLQGSPSDKVARLRLSQMGIKWGRPDLIDARLEALPTPDEATPVGGALAVDILRQQGDRFEAVKYAYELVRRNYDEPDANASLIMAFFAPASRPLTITEVSEAGPGTAVRYDEGDGRERWAIIEDSPGARPELDEFPVNHPLSFALTGCRVGDTVVLSKTHGRDRTAVVKEILSKYVYRVRDIAM
jgi:tetratricopeptide (TPR) repeat protein